MGQIQERDTKRKGRGGMHTTRFAAWSWKSGCSFPLCRQTFFVQRKPQILEQKRTLGLRSTGEDSHLRRWLPTLLLGPSLNTYGFNHGHDFVPTSAPFSVDFRSGHGVSGPLGSQERHRRGGLDEGWIEYNWQSHRGHPHL